MKKLWVRFLKEEDGVGVVELTLILVVLISLVLIFKDFNIRLNSAWCWWLALSFLLLVCYELYWVRYFRSEKTMADFYSSFLGVPVAGATLPVAAFFLLAVYGRNLLLGAAVIVLGIGHIGIHLMHRKELTVG